jgi:DNA repair protein RecN (Recombination protein N)
VLTELRIRNVAIIESVTLALTPGFNVLTGETGAGKSIVVEALGLLFGERASSDLVRTGAEKAAVEGVFDLHDLAAVAALLDERGIEVEQGIAVFKREVAASGRSRAWINGTPVTTGVLSEVGARLVNIHGQHETRGLVDADSQRVLLDAFAGAQAQAAAVAGAWDELDATRAELAELTARKAAAEKRADYLRHVAREIGDARLQPGEDARLDEEFRRLSNVGDLRLHVEQLRQAVEDEELGAVHALSVAQRALGLAVRLDPSLDRLREMIDAADVQLQELAREVAHYEQSLDVDPQRLAEVERRRDMVFRLIRKHGGSVESTLAVFRDTEEELALVDGAAVDLGRLAQRAAAAREALQTSATALTHERKRAARSLAKQVDAVLPQLGMPDGHLSVRLVPRPEIARTGAEDVEFAVALNVGHDARPLSRVASGGELSRVMLALKTVLARLDGVPTLVFDEVDAGIGGAVALQVGDTMRRVAAAHQVLAITHLPQIASRAHRQVVVAKGAKGGVTTADIAAVDGEARVREIARMLGGDAESTRGRAHARELLEGARA